MRTLFSAEVIAGRVARLGGDLTAEFAGQPLTVVGVLHGSVVLVADLIRRIATPHQLGFVRASSYRGATTTGDELRLDLSLLPDLTGRDVLLVDDILDTGRTLAALVPALTARGARRVVTAVLLWKPSRTIVALRPDFFAFEIPDEFVVGYGLDYNGDYRHLPEIAVLEPGDL